MYGMDISNHSTQKSHWDAVFDTKKFDEVSWYQADPHISLELITQYSSPLDAVVDIGAGASVLVDKLLDSGFVDVTLVDISSVALTAVADRLGDKGKVATLVTSDVTEWQPQRTFKVWHDRAVFHFLHDAFRAKYVQLASEAIAPGGYLILGTFAPDGPEQCSGLPVNRYDSQMIAEVFSKKFVRVESAQEQHRTPFGTTQSFTWTVLQRAR